MVCGVMTDNHEIPQLPEKHILVHNCAQLVYSNNVFQPFTFMLQYAVVHVAVAIHLHVYVYASVVLEHSFTI